MRHVAVSDEVISALIASQFPHLADFELGGRHVYPHHLTVRIGDRFAVNLPTSIELDPQVLTSAEWTSRLAPRWTFPAGTPLLTGEPSADYPYHWYVARWLEGSNAATVSLRADAAPRLARALSNLHAKAPRNAPKYPESALGLARMTSRWTRALAALDDAPSPNGAKPDAEALDSVWREGVGADVDIEPRWTHGNLDARFVISDRGSFNGIVCWFTLGAGDPAVDLGAACLLLPHSVERAFLEAYGPLSPATRSRACAYRALRSVEYATSDNPFLRRLGWERMADYALLEPAGRRHSA